MDFQINRTQDGTKQYPLHRHNQYEIMIYLSGEGFLKTNNENYAFTPGTIIIVPPRLEHGSSSENGFVNISVVADLGQYLFLKSLLYLMTTNTMKAAHLPN